MRSLANPLSQASASQVRGFCWSTLVLLLAACGLLSLGASSATAKQPVDYFGTETGSGTLGGEFDMPKGIAVNNTGAGAGNRGDVYVVDALNDRIERFGRSDNGTPADPTDDTYFFVSAWGAGVDSVANGNDYEVCTIAAQCQAGVSSDVGGALSHTSLGSHVGTRSTGGIDIDQDTGQVYVVDADHFRINVYEGDGAFLRTFGYDVVASGPGHVAAPSEQQQLTVKADGGRFSLEFRGQATGARGTGLRNLADTVVQSVVTTQGTFTVGEGISGRGIVPGTTIVAAEAGSIRLSQPTVEASTIEEPLFGDRFDHDVTAGEIEAALNALPSIGGVGGSVTVTGGPGDASGSSPFTIKFGGSLAGQDLPPIRVTQGGLTRTGGGASATIEEAVKGGAYEVCVPAEGDVCKAGSAGSGTGELGEGEGIEAEEAAHEIAVSQPDGNPTSGRIFLADTANRRVSTYALDGSAPGSFGSAAVFSARRPQAIAVDSRGIVYASNQVNQNQIERYDSENVNGSGVGFLSPIAAPPLDPSSNQRDVSPAFEVAPDSDASGPDTDVLYVLRQTKGNGFIQQFGPANPPGLTTPPAAVDDEHAADSKLTGVLGLAHDESDGRIYLSGGGYFSGGQWQFQDGVYVLDDPTPPPTASLDSITDVSATSATVNATINPNGPPTLRYQLEYSPDGSAWVKEPSTVLGTQKTPQQVSVALDPPGGGLLPDTEYRVRLVAQRPLLEPIVTSELSFSTLDSPPLAETVGSPVRTADSARLDGRVDPRNAVTSYHFEYGSDGPCDANPCAQTPSRSAGVSEVQTVSIKATAGQFKLSFEGETTADLPFDVSAAAMQSALEALPSIGSGNLAVSGGPGNATGTAPYRLGFRGALGARDVDQVTVAKGASPLVGEASATSATQVQGTASANETQTVRIKAAAGQFKLTFGGDSTSNLKFDSTASEVDGALEALPSIGAGNVFVGGGPGGPEGSSPYTVTFIAALAKKNVGQIEATGGTQPLIGASGSSVTTTVSGGATSGFLLVSEEIHGLEPGTTYHYRVVADNGNPGSPVHGEDMTVSTFADEDPLSHGRFPGPPDSDRAWEQVNAPDTGGNPVWEARGFSSDGNRAMYRIAGGTPDSDTGSLFAMFYAEREETGPHQGAWQTRQITPSRDQLVGPAWEDSVGTDDLTSLAAANTEFTLGAAAIWRFDPFGRPTLLYDRPSDVQFSGGVWISGDGSRVVTKLNGPADPAYPAAATVENLYDVSAGSARLVRVLPDGSACTKTLTPDQSPRQSSGWISDDGSLAFFQCGAPLYARDLVAGTTTAVSGPPLSGPDCGGRLERAIPKALFFSTSNRLSPSDTNPSTNCAGDARDIYRYDLASDSRECLTCVLKGGDAEATFLALAEDGSRLYFSSPRRLLLGAPEHGGLYRLDVGDGDLAYVGPAETEYLKVSPDGSKLVFRSNSPALNALGGQSNGGTSQYYLYDDRDRSLVCVSCPPDGGAPTGSAQVGSAGIFGSPGFEGPNQTYMSDAGIVAFSTPTPLAGPDQNTAGPGQDPAVGQDVYEWRDGRLLLITDGLTRWPSSNGPNVSAVSPSGRDVFFLAAAQYTTDALDGYKRLYDARIGGGFEFPKPPPPCPLEVCQGIPRGAPEEQAPGTGTLAGSGGSTAAKGRRCPKGRHRVQKDGKSRCAKQSRKARHKKRGAGHRGGNAR